MADFYENELKDKISLLPSDPGVYQFIDSEGVVIYVGKAKNLKKRVSSYFVSRNDHTSKVRILVRNIRDIKHIVVSSENDALLLENNLIKSLQPKYNINLKDDKTYPWIVIKNEPFSRIMSTRSMIKDGSRYYGPFASVFVQRQVLDFVRKLYYIRNCKYNLTRESIKQGKYSPCLEFHIGNCKAPCVGRQSLEEYNENLSLAAKILKGDLRTIENHFNEKMIEASKNMRFEEAQQYKERLELIKNYQSKTVIVNSMITNLDIFSIIIEKGRAFCNFMRIVSGAILSSFTIELKLVLEENDKEILSYAISKISELVEGGINREVIVPFMPNESLFPEISFTVPQRGDKLKILELSQKNCFIYKLERDKQIEKVDPAKHADRIMQQMKIDLYLDNEPRYIECFDNSNIQGTNPVASCVVFRDGVPSRKEYRHFNIKTVIGANDFASMREVLTRRYTRLLEENAQLPSLIVVDGGKGQLSFAADALRSLGLYGKIPIVGLAKKLEEIYFPEDSTPHYLNKNSSTLKVLMHIRDEAHRFGINFHRKKRSQEFIKNELESIPFLGDISIDKLLKKYKTASAVKSAPFEELSELVGNKRAEKIKEYFSTR